MGSGNTKIGGVLGWVVAFVLMLALLAVRQGYEQRLGRIQARVAVLEEEKTRSSQAAGPVTNGLPSEEFRELMRLRAEVSNLRQLKTQVVTRVEAPSVEVVKKTEEAAGVNGPQFLAPEAWGYLGFESPGNALQSWAWAMRSGNLEVFLASLTVEAQRATAERLQGLSREEVAEKLRKEISPLKGLRLDRMKVVSEQEVRFVLGSEEKDDGETKTRDEAVATFRQVGNEWRMTEGF